MIFWPETSSSTVAAMNFICISNLSRLKSWVSLPMRRICSPMHRVEFPDASQKGNVKLRVNLRILTKIGLIGNQIFLVRFVVKPIKHIIAGTTRIRGYRLVRK